MTTIHIKGPMISNDEKWIYDLFEIDSTCPNDVLSALDGEEDITVIVNSGGGLLDCGNEIYTALMNYQGHVTVDIIKAYSAASVAAMAGDTVRISPVGEIMIHNVASEAWGDYHAMDKGSERLQKANKSAAAAYRLKTGLSQEELLSLMDKETWLTAEEAKEKGFVDEILFQDASPRLVANCAELLPARIITTMQELGNTNQLSKTPAPISGDKLMELAKLTAEEVYKKIAENKVNHREPALSRFLF